MAFTFDVTTSRGKVRLLCSDTVEASAFFQDAEIDYFLGDSADHVKAAARKALSAKLARLSTQPANSTLGSYTEGYDLNAIKNAIVDLDKQLEAEGVDLSGEDQAAFGSVDIGRDAHSYVGTERNKAARGEDY